MRMGIVVVSLASGLLFCASCGTTYQTRDVKESGFLKDYSGLQRGGEGEPRLVYYNTNTDIRIYHSIKLDPVAAYLGEHSRLKNLSKEDRQVLLNYFDAALRKQLSEDYRLVDETGPGVMHIRLAMTDAHGSKMVMDTLSTITPIGIAASALERVALGETLAVGSACVEAEVLDGATGERLAAMVDQRAGAKVTGKLDKWSKWHDAKAAFDYWALRLRLRLENFRARAEAKAAGLPPPIER